MSNEERLKVLVLVEHGGVEALEAAIGERREPFLGYQVVVRSGRRTQSMRPHLQKIMLSHKKRSVPVRCRVSSKLNNYN